MRATTVGLGIVLAALAAAAWAAPDGYQSLVDAAQSKDRAAVLSMVAQGADAKAKAADGTTALHWAAHWNDLAMAQALVKAGADVRAKNRYAATPLSEAARNASGALIALLLDAGADPDTMATQQGETVLMAAARVGNVEGVKTLLDHGAFVEARENYRGQTALMWAAAEGHAGVIDVLIANGANVAARSDDRDTSPPKLLAGTPSAPIPRGGLSALHFAARQGHTDAVQALLQGGANIDQADSDGNSALVLALLNLHWDMARLLLEAGADPNVANKTGRAALYTAIDMHDKDWSPRPDIRQENKTPSIDVIRLMLEKGADTNLKLTAASPIIMAAQDGGDRTIAEGGTPFMRAARSADVGVMRMLLAKGADPKIAQKDGLNALMLAAGVSWGEKIQGTPEQALEASRLCLELGLDVNAATGRGDTALHGAAGRGADEIVKLLAENGAKLDARNKQNFTPLDIAMGKVRGGGQPGPTRESTVALLKSLGAPEGGPEEEKPPAISTGGK